MLFDLVSIVIIGLLSGLLLGVTGILPLGFFIIILKYLNVGDYKTIIGTVLYVILFPLSIGSVWEFYKAKNMWYSAYTKEGRKLLPRIPGSIF